jgi:CheY-like chemotaxis protein
VASREALERGDKERAPVVLIVEDDVLIRFITSELLRAEGYTVFEAVDAAEGLALVQTGRDLDIVLSDVRMTGDDDGLVFVEVLKDIRPDIPAILLSAHLSPEIDHKADAFLSKPFRTEALMALIDGLIGSEWQSARSSPSAS